MCGNAVFYEGLAIGNKVLIREKIIILNRKSRRGLRKGTQKEYVMWRHKRIGENKELSIIKRSSPLDNYQFTISSSVYSVLPSYPPCKNYQLSNNVRR